MSSPPPTWLARGKRVVAWLEDSVLVSLLLAMILVATAQILLRNVWDSGLAWGDPFTKVMVLWLGMLGAMVASRNNNHINIDLLSRFLPPKIKSLSQVINATFTAVVCGVITYHAARLVLIDKDAGTTAFVNVPTWVCELIIPIGFAVIGLRYAAIAVSGLIPRGERHTP